MRIAYLCRPGLPHLAWKWTGMPVSCRLLDTGLDTGHWTRHWTLNPAASPLSAHHLSQEVPFPLPQLIHSHTSIQKHAQHICRRQADIKGTWGGLDGGNWCGRNSHASAVWKQVGVVVGGRYDTQGMESSLFHTNVSQWCVFGDIPYSQDPHSTVWKTNKITRQIRGLTSSECYVSDCGEWNIVDKTSAEYSLGQESCDASIQEMQHLTFLETWDERKCVKEVAIMKRALSLYTTGLHLCLHHQINPFTPKLKKYILPTFLRDDV